MYILGNRPCVPKSQIMFKRPWVLTRDTNVHVHVYKMYMYMQQVVRKGTRTIHVHCTKVAQWTKDYDTSMLYIIILYMYMYVYTCLVVFFVAE